MNELRANVTWPGATLTVADDASFVPQYLTPVLAAAGLHPIVFGSDDTELSGAQALLSGPAGPELGGIAFHCYQGLEPLSTLHADYPSEPIIIDECSPASSPTRPPRSASTQRPTGPAPYRAPWNLALDPSRGPYETVINRGACRMLVTVDETTHEARLNLNYYQYGQISK